MFIAILINNIGITKRIVHVCMYHLFPRRSSMLNILFCYAKEHPHIGYRQGMHELLAPLLFVLHAEDRGDLTTEDSMRYYFGSFVYKMSCKMLHEILYMLDYLCFVYLHKDIFMS